MNWPAGKRRKKQSLLAWLKCKYGKINKEKYKQMERCECRAWNIKLMKTEKTGKENTKHAC